VKRGKPVADLCIKASGSISPHISSTLEDVVGEKKKHDALYYKSSGNITGMEVQTATLGTNIPSSLKHFRMKLRSNTGS
jgi:hypothetical protein